MALDLRQNFVSAQYLENQLVEFHQILYMHSSGQDLAWDCYMSFFAHLYRVMALYLCQNLVYPQYPKNKLTEIHQIKFYVCIHSAKIWVGIITCYFLLIYNNVMALDLCQNFVPGQCL